ncbi:DUF2269 domain-containing protein [Leeia sp. TBRC 13508]|uniref:DUF2269 domain-containing protein n=1 Tax=Leeia speluncae TaxID=2884804 RepID=A0ABS8D477_9NEIS|nr:DUF2269 domain-containing protein [Leeia speluncae]MCB6182937.1 DUF2269 domain-containing protein [Leeia speluncae]
MDYLTTKWLHILSATFMFGTGFGTAFYLFFAGRSKNVQAIAVVAKWVVKADTWFTTPSVIIQPLSGFWMIHLAGYPLTSGWIIWSLGLYAMAGICWLPVLWLQLKMRDMAIAAAHQQAITLPDRYWQFERYWTLLGIPAFGGLVVVYWLMVNKPF